MKQTHNYEVNFAEQKIIVTKKFAKAAGVIGSMQYKELAQIRRDFPDFTIELREIKRKENLTNQKGKEDETEPWL